MGAGVDVTRHGDVGVVAIRNPEQRNALSAAVRDGLYGALTGLLSEEDDCRAIVLTGAGGTFCSGGAIDSMGEMTAFQGRQRMQRAKPLVRLLTGGEKPIVAAVERYAYGAGFSLALLCDSIVAARDAKFCASFGRIGLMPDMGMLWSLPQRVGVGRARRIMMLAEVIEAEEGARIGLVDALAEPGGALDAALERARAFAAAAPLPNRLTREALAHWPLPLEAALAYEAQGQGVLFGSEDQQEGLRAFFEKRPPQFRGA